MGNLHPKNGMEGPNCMTSCLNVLMLSRELQQYGTYLDACSIY